MKKILKTPNPLLHKRSADITNFKEAKKIAKELIETTESVDRPWRLWLGMAAPQIGYNKKVIVLRKSYKNYQVMVNPKILERKWKSIIPLPTRCFSLTGVYLTRDYLWLKVQHQDLKGKTQKKILRGGKARIFQQEINHLDGILLTDIGTRIL